MANKILFFGSVMWRGGVESMPPTQKRLNSSGKVYTIEIEMRLESE